MFIVQGVPHLIVSFYALNWDFEAATTFIRRMRIFKYLQKANSKMRMQKICRKYAENMQKICRKYAENMQKICRGALSLFTFLALKLGDNPMIYVT